MRDEIELQQARGIGPSSKPTPRYSIAVVSGSRAIADPASAMLMNSGPATMNQIRCGSTAFYDPTRRENFNVL
jgi:hypothetical protein